MSKKHNSQKKISSQPEKVVSRSVGFTSQGLFVNIYLFFMFTVFPLILTAQFAQVRHDKYYTFLVCTFLLLFFSLISLVTSTHKVKTVKSSDKFAWFKRLSSTDKMALVFFAVSILSTLFSSYKELAFFGNTDALGSDISGRNNGLLLIIFYAICYVILSRHFYFMEFTFIVFVLVSSLTCGLGILNFFYQHPFGIFRNYAEKHVVNFISTFGNKNIFSSYICLFLPVAAMLFLTSRKHILRVFYLIGTGFAFCGLIVADSDSGYIAFAVFMLVSLLFCIRRYSRLKDYLTMLAVMLLSGKILRLISLLFNDKTKGTDYFANILIYKNETFILLIAISLVIAAMHYFEKKNPELKDKEFSKLLFWGVVAIATIMFLTLVSIFLYFTFIDTKTELTGIAKLFRFNEYWGTHRGYMWIRCTQIFQNYYNLKDKLIGAGPETLSAVFMPYYGKEINARFGENLNSAHNEYLHYLITHGIIGIASYIGIIVTSVYRSIKKAKFNYTILAFTFAILSYASQAVVNIAQPITTPIFIIFIAIAENLCRSETKSPYERRI